MDLSTWTIHTLNLCCFDWNWALFLPILEGFLSDVEKLTLWKIDVKIIDCMVTKNCCLCNMQLKCERGRHYLKNSLFVLRWLDSLLKIMSIPFTLWRKLNINIVILNKLYLKTYINPVTVNVFEGWDRDHPSAFHLHFKINAHVQQNGTKKRISFKSSSPAP